MRLRRAHLPKKGRLRKPLIERLLGRVRVDAAGCWIFTGCIGDTGYGRIGIVTGVVGNAHRVAYDLLVGPVPDDLCVLHRCDVRSCVNPDHLFLGSRLDNVADMIAKGRNVTGEKCNWAKLTDAQVAEIRQRYRSRMGEQLAIEFGVNRRHIAKIIRNETRNTPINNE